MAIALLKIILIIGNLAIRPAELQILLHYEPTRIYSDTGTFVYKLVINRGQQCSDSATQIRKVYPGFFPGFTITGGCVNTAIQFTDTTKSKYGVVSAWRWDFGNPSATGDTSIIKKSNLHLQDNWKLPVQLTVSNRKDVLNLLLTRLRLLISLLFNVTNDTLICSIDTLQLIGDRRQVAILWTPDYNINNQNSFNPLVSPKVTTTYTATLTEAPGCFATKPVVVA